MNTHCVGVTIQPQLLSSPVHLANPFKTVHKMLLEIKSVARTLMFKLASVPESGHFRLTRRSTPVMYSSAIIKARSSDQCDGREDFRRRKTFYLPAVLTRCGFIFHSTSYVFVLVRRTFCKICSLSLCFSAQASSQHF